MGAHSGFPGSGGREMIEVANKKATTVAPKKKTMGGHRAKPELKTGGWPGWVVVLGVVV